MSLTPKHVKAINDIAELLYDFLPNKPHPRANQAVSFQGVANELGLLKFFIGGSKLPTISTLLSSTYEFERGKFCKLIITIVNKGITYKAKKNPMTKNEIAKLNELILILGFKIPELWDNSFLNSLVKDKDIEPKNDKNKQIDYDVLLNEFLLIQNLDPNVRGFAFERFLNKLFCEFELTPRPSFRLSGEQIDGSLELDSEYYLIEAKWKKQPLGNSDMLTFNGKIMGKSSWTRGIIISYSGFSKEGLEAFGRGRATNLITLDGQDIYALLHKKISLVDGLKKKIRWAAETGEVAKSIFELFA
ncbi:MAG: restriction endonuclease [Chitinispirillales bacterium]|jgi:hypothetical protein|nr:restriction endonuclease [Chitinispirillales bacterium]